MKKIIQIILIAMIPLVLIVGGLYLVGNMKKNNIINDAVESIENPYYKALAQQCGQGGDDSIYKCCLASVYDMAEVEGKLATEPVCANLRSEQLSCPGSYEWCVPIANVTMSKGAELDNGNDHSACEVDADCVPATCCHATDVVHKDFAPKCAEINCTMSCETELDCGQGESVCNDGICVIEAR